MLMILILASTISCTVAAKATKSPAQMLADFTQCSGQLQTLGQCINTTTLNFNVTKYENSILKCYSDICQSQPPFALDTPAMMTARQTCATSLDGEYSSKIMDCLTAKVMALAAAGNVADLQQINSLSSAATLFAQAARIRYRYLVGGDASGIGVNQIPTLILPKTMSDYCGNVTKGASKVKSCIQKVSRQANSDFNKYRSAFTKCYNGIKKCLSSYNLIAGPICDCETQLLPTMSASLSAGDCSAQSMTGQADAPKQLMQQLQVCDDAGKQVKSFKFWWQQGLN